MSVIKLQRAVVALIALAGCEPAGPSGVVVGNNGVGARVESGRVRAAAGPDDAAVAVRGERVIVGVGSDQAAAGVRVGDGPIVAGGGHTERGGLFGGVGFGF